MIGQNLKYLASHEWVKVDAAGGMVTVGLTDYAVEQLGDIVYLELPKVGASVKHGSAFGAIESVKAASDLYSPVSGEVVDVNGPLSEKLDVFKEDAYGAAWLVKIKMSDAGELDELMDAGAYEKHIAVEED